MARKKRIAGVVLSLLILIIVLHMSYHFAVIGTGLSGFYEKGISGYSVGKFPLGEEIRNNYKIASPISKLILGIEWALVIIVVLFIFIRNKTDLKKELSSIKTPEKYRKTEKSTELD